MTKPKNNDGLIDLKQIRQQAGDESVQRAIQRGQRRQAQQGQSKRAQQHQARERRKAESRKGRRALYDLDPAMIAKIQRLAKQHHTTASQIAALALSLLLDQVEQGQVDIRDYLIPIVNPYYENRVQPPTPAPARKKQK